MNGKSNKAAIGAFVLVALVLLVTGVAVFGSGKLFSKTGKLVVFFEGSVKGLNIGSPVMFRGVKVGSVTDIEIDFNPEKLSVTIPVTIEIERDKFRGMESDRSYLNDLIGKGLRAQLQMQSIVTGQLAIYLDFYPDTPIVLRAKDSKYPEIPTILSKTEELQKTLSELPLEDMVEKVRSTMDGIDRLVNSPELMEAVSSLGTTAKEVQTLVRNLDRQVQSVGEETRRTAKAATGAFQQAEKFLAMDEGVPGEVAKNLNTTLTEAHAALQKTEAAMEAVRRTASDERTAYKLRQALEEMSNAARSIHALVDYLERHPEALLRGKDLPKGE